MKMKSFEIIEHVKDVDIEMRNPKSGSVPGLMSIISSEERQVLVNETVPADVAADEKTAWYIGKLNALGDCSLVPVEKYVSNKKCFKHRCIVCGYEAEVKPANVESSAKRGRRGCNGCNHRNGTSLEDACRLFKIKNPRVEPLSGFTTQQDKIKVRCLTCGHNWETKPSYLLLGGKKQSGCPKCGNNGHNRKTHEHFVEEVKILNPDIKILGQYVNANTHILVRHISCGHEWEVSPRTLLQKRGCPKCRNNMGKSNGRKKTHECFLAEMKAMHPDIEVIGEYVNNRTKIKVKHLPCGREFEITPGSLLRGRGCSHCNRKRRVIDSRKSHSQFLDEVQAKHPDIEILSEYINSKTKVKARHTQCKHEWMVQPNKLLAGQGCPKCNKLPRITSEEYRRRLEEKNIIYIPLAQVQNADTKIPHLCPECNTTWDISPYNVLLGYGCPKCHSNRQSYEEVVSNLKKVAPTIKLVDEYRGKNTHALFECLECGHEWRTAPYEVLHGTGCPKCTRRKSFPEISVYYFLNKDLPYNVLLNPRVSIPHLGIKFEADIFIPELKLFIEYDGIYWHADLKVEQRDIKREQAIYKSGYKCLHIMEYNETGQQRKSWMKDPPLFIEAKNHKANSTTLDQCVLTLESKLGIETRNFVNCLSDKQLIEEAYKKAPVYKITILENGNMEVENNGNKKKTRN